MTALRWLRTFEALCVIMLLSVVGPGLYLTHFDGRLRPPIGRLHITAIEALPGHRSRISGWAVKPERPGCKWQRTEFYIGRLADPAAAVPVTYEDRPQARSGRTEWTGIIVGMDPTDVIFNSHALAKYRCLDVAPYAGFETTAVFHLGDGSQAGVLDIGVMK